MEVTNVKFWKNEQGGGLLAYADVEFDGEIWLKGFKVFNGAHGVFVRVPQEKGQGDKWYDRISWSDATYYEDTSKQHPIIQAVVDRWQTQAGSTTATTSAKPQAKAPASQQRAKSPW